MNGQRDGMKSENFAISPTFAVNIIVLSYSNGYTAFSLPI